MVILVYLSNMQLTNIMIYLKSNHLETYVTRFYDMFMGSQSQAYVICNATSTRINVCCFNLKWIYLCMQGINLTIKSLCQAPVVLCICVNIKTRIHVTGRHTFNSMERLTWAWEFTWDQHVYVLVYIYMFWFINVFDIHIYMLKRHSFTGTTPKIVEYQLFIKFD